MSSKTTVKSSLMGLFRFPIVWGLKAFAFMAFVGIFGTLFFKDRTIGNALMVIFPVAGFFAYYLAKKYDETLDGLRG